MVYKEIDQLLEAYWAGETDAAAEAQLRQFFQQQHLPEPYQKYRPLFQYYTQEQQRSYSGTIPALSSPSEQKNNWSFQLPKRWLVAASLLILVGIWITLSIYGPKSSSGTEVAVVDITADTYVDEDLAYEQTEKALKILSSRLNSGKRYQRQVKKLTNLSIHLNSQKLSNDEK